MTSGKLRDLKLEYQSLINQDLLSNVFSQNLDNLKWNRSFFMKNIKIYKKLFATHSFNISYEQYERRLSRILEVIPDFCQKMWKKEKLSNFTSDIFNEQINGPADSSDNEDVNENKKQKKDQEELHKLIYQTSKLFSHIKYKQNSDPSQIFLREPNPDDSTDDDEMSNESSDQFNFMIYEILQSFFMRLYQFQNSLPYKNELIDQEIQNKMDKKMNKLMIETLIATIDIRLNKLEVLKDKVPEVFKANEDVEKSEIFVLPINKDELEDRICKVSKQEENKNKKIASKYNLIIDGGEKVKISLKISATGSIVPLIDDSKRRDPHNFYEGFNILKEEFITVEASPCENYLIVKSGKKEEYKRLYTWRVFWIDYKEEQTHFLDAFLSDDEENIDVYFNSDFTFNSDSIIIETNTIEFFQEYQESINVHFIDKHFEVVQSSLLFTDKERPLIKNSKVLI